MSIFDWSQQASVLSGLNDRINWALDNGAGKVFYQAVNYRADLLGRLHRLAKQELAQIETAEDLTVRRSAPLAATRGR